MRDLILKMSISVDGFVSDLDGRNTWMFGADQEAKAWSVEYIGNASLHIMGSRSFRDMATYWQTSTDQFAPQYPIESVDKALKLVLLLAEQPEIRLSEATRYLGVASSTAHRLLAMLQYRGFVRQDPASSRRTSAQSRAATGPVPFVVRSSVRSWSITRTSSFVRGRIERPLTRSAIAARSATGW